MDIIDIVSEHLLKQNEKSMANGVCAYRGKNSAKCAVGFLIKDEHYSPDLEEKIMGHVLVNCAVEASIGKKLSEQEFCALKALQEVHDREFVVDWPAKLELVRQAYPKLPERVLT